MNSKNLLRGIAEKTSSDNKLSELFSKYQNKIYFSDLSEFVYAIRTDSAHKQGKGRTSKNLRILFAHQPVLLPYEAIIINYLLMGSLKNQLSEQLNVTIESLHLVLDLDISNEPRFRNASIPSPLRKNGIVKLIANIKMENRYMPMLSMEHDPSALLEQLKKLRYDLNMEMRIIYKLGITNNIDSNNYRCILEQIENCIMNRNLSLSSIYTSKILANNILKTDTVFVNYSDLIVTISDLSHLFNYAIERLRPYTFKLVTIFNDLGVDIPNALINFVNGKYFWGICYRCFARNDLIGHNRDFKCSICGADNSVILGGTYILHNRFICPQVIPKVILEEYFLLYYYGCDAFVTYSGGAEHIIVSNMLYTLAGLNPVPTLIWRPHTEFVSPAEIFANHAETDIVKKYTNSNKINEALRLHASGRASWLYPLMYMSTSNYKTYWDNYFRRHIWDLF